jgi:hypothetical protein
MLSPLPLPPLLPELLLLIITILLFRAPLPHFLFLSSSTFYSYYLLLTTQRFVFLLSVSFFLLPIYSYSYSHCATGAPVVNSFG